jgi:hypothetical protein
MRVFSPQTVWIAIPGHAGDVHVEGRVDAIQNEGLTFGVEIENILPVRGIPRTAESVLDLAIAVGYCQVVRAGLAIDRRLEASRTI